MNFLTETVDKFVQEYQKVISKTVKENTVQIHNEDKDIKQLTVIIAALINELGKEFN